MTSMSYWLLKKTSVVHYTSEHSNSKRSIDAEAEIEIK